jgi:hypothetical protein
LGSYTAILGNPRKHVGLDIRVQDTLSGDTIAEDAVSGNEEELFEMAAHAGADLRTSLGIYPLAPEAAKRIRASLSASSEAVRHYSQGSAKLWAVDFMGAREELSKAVAADPNYPLAHSALSDAFWHLGYRSKASAEAKRALNLSTQLPEQEQLVIAGQYARSLDDWPNAVKAYKTLFETSCWRPNVQTGQLRPISGRSQFEVSEQVPSRGFPQVSREHRQHLFVGQPVLRPPGNGVNGKDNNTIPKTIHKICRTYSRFRDSPLPETMLILIFVIAASMGTFLAWYYRDGIRKLTHDFPGPEREHR